MNSYEYIPYQDYYLYEQHNNTHIRDDLIFTNDNCSNHMENPYKAINTHVSLANNRESMMRQIQALGLSALNANLSLDVCPNDQKMLTTFNEHNDAMQAMIIHYENAYGPISLNSKQLNQNPWKWLQGPWPWEN